MSDRSRRVLRAIGAAGILLALSGCVVVPAYYPRHAYYYHPYRYHYFP